MGDAALKSAPVILFDGECNLCNASVLFVLKRERAARYCFASLQSSPGKALLQQHGYPPGRFDSFVLIENDRLYIKSDAALRVARQLRGPWPLLSPLSLLPRTLRDCVYDVIGARRYRWFGKAACCCATRPELRSRFLSSEPYEATG